MTYKSLKIKKSTYKLLRLARAKILAENPTESSSYDNIIKKVLGKFMGGK